MLCTKSSEPSFLFSFSHRVLIVTYTKKKELVACMPIGKNTYLQRDLNIRCWEKDANGNFTGIHFMFVLYLFVPGVILWVIGKNIFPLYSSFLFICNEFSILTFASIAPVGVT